MQSVDLADPKEWPVYKKYGLVPTMIGGGTTIPDGFNRKENHAGIAARFRESVNRGIENGAPSIIVFSGNRSGMSDEEGLENCVIGLKQVMPMAEDKNLLVCMELLNSKVDHKDYMCDHTRWGVELVKRVGSPNFKLLYDIYHMQIMEGDVIRTIQGQPPVHRPLPHRRQSRPERDRRDAGTELQGHLEGRCRDGLQGLHGARVHSEARSDGCRSARRWTCVTYKH